MNILQTGPGHADVAKTRPALPVRFLLKINIDWQPLRNEKNENCLRVCGTFWFRMARLWLKKKIGPTFWWIVFSHKRLQFMAQRLIPRDYLLFKTVDVASVSESTTIELKPMASYLKITAKTSTHETMTKFARIKGYRNQIPWLRSESRFILHEHYTNDMYGHHV